MRTSGLFSPQKPRPDPASLRTDYLTPDSFVIKNDRGAKYLAFDAIELYYNAP